MPDPRGAGAAIGALFLLNGALFGVWASRVPAVVERFDLAPDRLGLLLLGLAAGAIAAFPVAGRLSDRWGARVLGRRAAFACALALGAVAAAPTEGALAVALALFGAAQGALDVAMNAWGAEAEERQGRPLLSQFHAMFSLGAGLGAASGWLAVRAGLGVEPHVALAGLLLAPALLAAARAPGWPARPPPPRRGGSALPPAGLLVVGLVALCATLGEGAMADWGAVLLHEARGATEAQAALGYAAFSAAMVALRLGGNRAVRRWGPATVARASGLGAAGGVLLAVLGPGLGWALAGFALMGAGHALVAPLAFSRAAAEPGASPGAAIAGVATFGYGGLLVGPPLIGFVAAGSSLPAAFGVLGVLALGVAALGGALAAPRGRAQALRDRQDFHPIQTGLESSSRG